MARKKPHPEHENLERWLVSYADFITLLFATFVVLYALSQVDIGEFIKIQDAMRAAFSAPTLIEGNTSLLDSKGESILEASADSVVAPLMLEYVSQKYEEESYREIESEINEMSRKGEIDGVDVSMTNEGLLITFKDDLLFHSGTATLTNEAMKVLDKVGVTVLKKFAIHYMRMVGHTDNHPIASYVYPSNWELSSARASTIIRYFISRLKFTPSLFTAVGYADTRPVTDNNTEKGRAQNRRVEILILKNKYKNFENPTNELIKMSKVEQEAFQVERIKTIESITGLSEAAKNLTNGNQILESEALKLNRSALRKISKSTEKVYRNSNEVNWSKTYIDTNSSKKIFDVNEEFKDK